MRRKIRRNPDFWSECESEVNSIFGEYEDIDVYYSLNEIKIVNHYNNIVIVIKKERLQRHEEDSARVFVYCFITNEEIEFDDIDLEGYRDYSSTDYLCYTSSGYLQDSSILKIVISNVMDDIKKEMTSKIDDYKHLIEDQ